jgi:acetyl-CoA C-acetyltransferase
MFGGMTLHPVYILSAVRTPIGKFGGSLASLTAADLGVVAAKAAIERAGVHPDQIGETIFGNARQAGGGPNPARQISVRSGVPQEAPAFTVNKACASGMKSIALAYQSILLGDASCILAGGTESMSRVPYYLEARWGYRLGNQEMVDGMYRDGFFCPLAKMVMGETAEVLAEQYKVSRDEQDEYALLSQTRAARAIAAGRFNEELAPVTIEGKKGATTFSRDEHPFPAANLDKLGKLAPVFSKTGTITAGNSSGITDGAAAVVIASETFVKRNNLKPLARITAVTSAGVDPRTMGIGPVPALRKLEEKHNLKLHDFGQVEVMYCFV